jgi:membrane-bound lytic murein transglycosylase B
MRRTRATRIGIEVTERSTANFLKGHGWRAGAGYQPGEATIQAWNAAPVYQQAIAHIGQQIDGGEGTSAGR